MASNDIDPKLKIIVIDDSKTIRIEVIAILRKIGFFYITEAVDGSDGWAKLAAQASIQEPYELILSDINMPKMNGIELLIKLRAAKPYSIVPIIMISAESEKMTILEAMSQGASDYILKPFNLMTIRKKILLQLQKS